jgi:hypothetical protein
MSEPEPVMFYQAVIPPGTVYVVTRAGAANGEPWPDHIAVTPQFLEMADRERVTHGDGFIRFLLPDDEALYGVAHGDDRSPDVNHYDLLAATSPQGTTPEEGEGAG